MIDDKQRIVVHIICLPVFARDAQIIDAVARNKLVAPDVEPLARSVDPFPLRIDVQAERRSPWADILDELHFAAVPGKQHGARALDALLGEHGLVGFKIEFRLYEAVRPDNARELYGWMLAQAEVQDW